MIRYRTADRSDLDQVLDWAAAEGWNPGRGDADAFFAADPGGFFVAEDTDTGDLVASVCVVNHTDSFAFLGLYLVRPAYRGRGIGLGLWHHAMAHAGDRCVGLDGVPDQQDNYATSGFTHAGATTRFTGVVGSVPQSGVRAAGPHDTDALIAHEADASGVRKPAYLRAWFNQTPQRKTIVRNDGDGITGMCTVRACRRGAKIGPLLARDTDTALALIRHAACLFSETLVIDVPQSASGLVALCQSLGLEPGFQTARMYRGAFTPGASDLYAVASLELG